MTKGLALLTGLLLLPFAYAVEPTADDEKKVQAYIAKQKAANIPPKEANARWKAGYTCNDLKQYSFAEYQECRYYYSVHGRFYPG